MKIKFETKQKFQPGKYSFMVHSSNPWVQNFSLSINLKEIFEFKSNKFLKIT